MAAREMSLVEVAAHLKEATDRTSELLASIDAERATVSREMLIESVRTHAAAILQEIWCARWALPVLLALTLVACSEPSGFEPPRRIYVQDQALEAPTDTALERWACAVGIEWERVTDPSNADLTVLFGTPRDEGQGQHTGRKIIVRDTLEGEGLATVLAHEFGHALGAEHIEQLGIMRPTVNDNSHCITASDLRSVCSEFGCSHYQPECLETCEECP